MKIKAHINRPRCLYSGADLIPEDKDLKPSPEHIIPLSLGGNNQFVLNNTVSLKWNNIIGNEVDEAAASLLPLLLQRKEYKLVGHRNSIPSWKFNAKGLGTTEEIDATLEFDSNDELVVSLKTQTENNIINGIEYFNIKGSSDDAIKILKGKLAKAIKENKIMVANQGILTDEEDLEIALMYAKDTANNICEFKTQLRFDLTDYYNKLTTFFCKIALCLGYKVLGADWAFGLNGINLRKALYPTTLQNPYRRFIKGTMNKLPDEINAIMDVKTNFHTMAVLPAGNKSVFAIMSLFGGNFSAIIELGDRRWCRKLINANLEPVDDKEVVFYLDIKNRKTYSRTLRELNPYATYETLRELASI